MSFNKSGTTALILSFFLTLLTARAADELTIQAHDFDRGNVRVSLPGEEYAGQHACIWNAGQLPNRAEYEIEFPVTADYTLSALYAAAQARPVEISLDGKKAQTGFSGVTGSWDTKSARWEQQCTLRITRGPHTLLLECPGPMPHICAWRVKSSVPFPDGWQLKRPSLEERARKAQALANRAKLERVNLEAVQRAIDDMERSFPGRYDAATHRRALAAFESGRKALLNSADDKLAEPDAADSLLAGIRTRAAGESAARLRPLAGGAPEFRRPRRPGGDRGGRRVCAVQLPVPRRPAAGELGQ